MALPLPRPPPPATSAQNIALGGGVQPLHVRRRGGLVGAAANFGSAGFFFCHVLIRLSK